MINNLIKKEIKSLDKIIEKTKGYSGAYMKELVDLTLIISKEEQIGIEKAMYQALKKIELQKKLIEEIKKNKKIKIEEDKIEDKGIEINKKEGKVISKKNRNIIDNTISDLKNTTEALEKLLILSESSKEPMKVDTPEKAKDVGIEKKVVKKTRKAHVQKQSESQLAVRILRQINKTSSYGLNKIKIKNN